MFVLRAELALLPPSQALSRTGLLLLRCHAVTSVTTDDAANGWSNGLPPHFHAHGSLQHRCARRRGTPVQSPAQIESLAQHADVTKAKGIEKRCHQSFEHRLRVKADEAPSRSKRHDEGRCAQDGRIQDPSERLRRMRIVVIESSIDAGDASRSSASAFESVPHARSRAVAHPSSMRYMETGKRDREPYNEGVVLPTRKRQERRRGRCSYTRRGTHLHHLRMRVDRSLIARREAQIASAPSIDRLHLTVTVNGKLHLSVHSGHHDEGRAGEKRRIGAGVTVVMEWSTRGRRWISFVHDDAFLSSSIDDSSGVGVPGVDETAADCDLEIYQGRDASQGKRGRIGREGIDGSENDGRKKTTRTHGPVTRSGHDEEVRAGSSPTSVSCTAHIHPARSSAARSGKPGGR
ncbi:hypothetical protein R3P38DRAFT_3360717 [Favolaschia claudopus]|uniref:Uncharacterized protein n=1 Tax=Favolaschia claudopus TaxID=2862362 RepID=A0AAW0AUE7_9AGAR